MEIYFIFEPSKIFEDKKIRFRSLEFEPRRYAKVLKRIKLRKKLPLLNFFNFFQIYCMSRKMKRSKLIKKLKKLPLLKRKVKSRKKSKKKSKRKSKRKSKTSSRKSMLPYLEKKMVLEKNLRIKTHYIDLLKEYSEKKTSLSEKNVLEVGSGNGRITFMLASSFHKWYALDPSVEMLNMAKKIKPKDISNVEFYEEMAEDLPFADNSIDIVLYTYSFHFVSNKAKALKETYRVLKDDGTMFIFEPSKIFGDKKIRFRSPEFEPRRYAKVLKRRKSTIKYISNIDSSKWKQMYYVSSDEQNINIFRKV